MLLFASLAEMPLTIWDKMDEKEMRWGEKEMR
jgi:hypothetical protein